MTPHDIEQTLKDSNREYEDWEDNDTFDDEEFYPD